MKKLKSLIYLTTIFQLGCVVLPTVTTKVVQAAEPVTKTVSYVSTKPVYDNPLNTNKLDANGDGKADYVVVWNNGGKRAFGTYTGKSDGTFNGCIVTPTNGNFTGDAVGRDTGIFADVTGEGIADYIVSWNNGGKRSFATYVGKGDGRFNEGVVTNCVSGFVGDTMEADIGTFADVNGDKKADYIVPWNNQGKRCFATYIAGVNGQFNECIVTNTSGGFIPDSVGRDSGIFTDITGDGIADYVVSWSNSGKRSFATYVGQGNGRFNEGVVTSTPDGFTTDTLRRDTGVFADITGDKRADFIVPWNNNGKRSFATYIAKSDGTFNIQVNTTTTGGFLANSIGRDMGTFADINGDGKVDYTVIWNNGGKRSLATYIANGVGMFNDGVVTSTSGGFISDTMGRDIGSFADVTGDGKADYIAPWNNNGTRSFATYIANANGTFNQGIVTTSNDGFVADKIGRDLGGLVGNTDCSTNDTSVFIVKTTTTPTTNTGQGELYDYEAKLIAKITSINYTKFGSQLNNVKNIYINNKSTYEAIAIKTGIPAVLICAIHYRESSCNFNTYINNGSYLPSGVNFTTAAVEAMLRNSYLRDEYGITSTCTDMAAMAGFSEMFNGDGYYRYHSIASPYVFSGTNVYTSGKYTSDRNFDANTVDAQPGIYIIVNKLLN